MNIIIVGCGKVGMTLAEQLSEEDHNLYVIDHSELKVQQAMEEVDAIGIVGNGTSIKTLEEADLEHADILIAVTGSDELNLLCCVMAKKASQCNTIARVRNPVYSTELGFIKDRLGISMIINPELTAAREISRLLRFPSAITLDSFAKGRIELLKFRVRSELPLDGMKVSELSQRLKCNILVCGVEREENLFIPGGDFVLHNNDLVSIIASPKDAAAFFYTIGIKTNQVKNAMIVGGGTIGFYLATLLLEMKIKVRIIENDKERCELLSELLPDADVIFGDGTNRNLLMEEGLATAEAFITLTNLDEENIMLSLFGKKNSKAKLVAKVNRIAFTDIIQELDIGSVVYPKQITADYILQYVRAMENSIGSNIETLYKIMEGRAEALEFQVLEQSEVTGIPLAEMKLKKNLLLCCINRGGTIITPRGQDCILPGDSVIVVTTEKGLQNIGDILQK